MSVWVLLARLWMWCCHDMASVRSARAWTCHALRPTYPDRMLLLIFWNLANWGLSVYGVGNTDLTTICLSAFLLVCLSVCLSACLSAYLLVCLSAYLFTFCSACLLVCLHACLLVCLLLVCLSACLPFCLSACLPICLCAYLIVCLSSCLPTYELV